MRRVVVVRVLLDGDRYDFSVEGVDGLSRRDKFLASIALEDAARVIRSVVDHG